MASKEPQTKATKTKTPKTTTAGIQTLASGTRVIPASLRADGTTRPERRVKPGFTPAEDIAKYQNRTAEAWRTRGVPGATEVVGEKTGGKKKRSRKKKTDAAAGDGKEGEDGEKEDGEEGGEGDGEDNVEAATAAAAATPVAATDAAAKTADAKSASEQVAAADKEKKAKALQKKIRQVRELNERKERGETLLPEQLDKALRLGELIKDLERLGVKHEE